MAKVASLSGNDLAPAKVRTIGAARQRGVAASAEYVPLQFRMPPDMVWEFKQAATDERMKYNEFLIFLFEGYKEQRGKAGQAKR